MIDSSFYVCQEGEAKHKQHTTRLSPESLNVRKEFHVGNFPNASVLRNALPDVENIRRIDFMAR